MNYKDDEEELRFLSIFAKTESISAIDLAAKLAIEREEKLALKGRTETQTMQTEFRKKKKDSSLEKQRLAQRQVTTQGYTSALHLHRNQDAVNRAARDLVDGRSTGRRPQQTATAGLPTAVVKGDKVETSLGGGVVLEVRKNGASLVVSVGWGVVHLQQTALVNYGVGAVPISLENAYQRAKALYSDGQVQEALSIWLQGIKMLQARRNPPSAALAAYMGAASQAERALAIDIRLSKDVYQINYSFAYLQHWTSGVALECRL